MNDKFIQVQGPFTANEDVFQYIKNNINTNIRYITKLGIQSKVKNMCSINNKIFEIGKTGILEFDNVEITSILFLQDEPESTLIDCIMEI